MSKRYSLLYILFFFSCSTHEEITNYTGKILIDSSPVLFSSDNTVVAHRGAWKKNNFPQNSIASLNEAIRLKCNGSEFDIQITADDSLVVCHDPTFNKLIIQNSKYSELLNFNLSNGEKLPTLREYILAAKQNNTTTKLFCELKNYSLSSLRRTTFVLKTLMLVQQLGANYLMVFISFDYEILKQIRALNFTSNIQYLSGDKPPTALIMDKISGVDYTLTVYKNNIDWIESAKNNNLSLNTWTLNTGTEMDWALEKKFDYITTDEPELLLSKQK